MGGSATNGDWDWELTNPPNSDSNSKEVRTVVLVGRTGNGKSSTGNSLLGREAFKSEPSSGGVTTTCEQQRTVLEDGRILNVIDTPGLFDFTAELERTGKEIVRCIDMAKDGIHAVLMVLTVRNRFSQEESSAIESLRNFFGSKINDYMILIFTGGDDLRGKTLDDYLHPGCPKPLKEILEMCGNRCVLFDNRTEDPNKKARQLKNLLHHVDVVVRSNDGKPYTNEIFVEMKKRAVKLDEDLTVKDNALSLGYPKQDMSESEEELLKRITEMVVQKLKEIISRLEEQLAAAQAAQERTNEELRELKEKFEKACEENENLKKEKNQRNSCAIL